MNSIWQKGWVIISRIGLQKDSDFCLSGAACFFAPMQTTTILGDCFWWGSSVEVIREPPANSQEEIEALSPNSSKETTSTNNLVDELGSNLSPVEPWDDYNSGWHFDYLLWEITKPEDPAKLHLDS